MHSVSNLAMCPVGMGGRTILTLGEQLAAAVRLDGGGRPGLSRPVALD